MRPTPARLVLASVLLAAGFLSPAARAADPSESHASTHPGVRAEFRQLMQELDLYLQSTHVVAPARRSEAAMVSPATKVRRVARRFASSRLAQLEAESPLSADERAEWRGLVRRHAIQALEAATPLPLPGAPALDTPGVVPNATGVLSGRITRTSDGTGIAASGVKLYWSTAYGYSSRSVTADASGNYSFTGLATNTYYVKTNNFDGYIDEAWNNVPCDTSCNPITVGTGISVTDGATTANIDLALAAGGRISGTVVSSATLAPIAGLNLYVYDSTGRQVTYGYTNAAGGYASYGGLVSGSYTVMTYGSLTSQPFIDELYNGIPCAFSLCSPTAGTPIAVTSPSTTTGINFALDPGGAIAGTVTDADTATGLSGVEVTIYAPDGRYVAYKRTDASGNYSMLANLPTGDYIAITSNGSGYLDEMWDNVVCPQGIPWSCGGVGAGTPIPVTAGSVKGGIDFALEKGGRIAGRVTDAATTAGIYSNVDIYTEDGRSAGYAYTDGAGNYVTGTGLPAGRYRAATWGYSGYIDEVYNDKPLAPLAEGSPINVTLGATTSGIDFALDKGGQITGHVTDASTTAGISGIAVDIYSPNGRFMSYGYTDSTGLYTTFEGGLPTGRYYARTYQWSSSGGLYVDEAYNNVPCAGCRPEMSGAPIDVTLGAMTSGIDFALDKGGSISGRMTSAVNGAGISGWVYAYTPSGSSVRSARADAGGNYTLGGLPSGRYVPRTTNTSGFVDEVYDDRPCVGYCDPTLGTAVSVAAGSVTPVNFALSPGARISGKVTDEATSDGISGVTIYVHKPPYLNVVSLTTDSLGNFATTTGSSNALPTGGYYVQTYNNKGYGDELYDNIPCVGCDVTTGTKVQLTSGVTTAGINFALATGTTAGVGRISGRVTRAGTGDPLPLLAVRIYNTGGQVGSLTTDWLGNYLSGSLPAGTYYVAAIVSGADYANELYNNVPFCTACSPTTGTPVSVTAGLTTTGIDIALDAGGRIEGRVTEAATGAPLPDARVSVYDTGNRLVSTVGVDALGNFAVNGLVPGTYYALAGRGGPYVSELYSSISCPACLPNTGTAITVTAGNTTSAIDFALDKGGRIEGTVTRAPDGSPVGASVTIYDATGAVAGGSVQDGAGHYRSLSGLPSGTYYARASDSAGTYDTELYNNKSCNSCNPTTGDAITVTAPAATTGIDFSLDTRSLDFYTLSPCRVVDTRNPPSALGGPALSATKDRIFSVFAKCGIPLTAKALSVNVTATGSTAQGNLRLHAAGDPVPTASTLNYVAGQTRANNAVVPVSRFGELAVYCAPSGTVHFILDVNGYFQ